MYIFKKFDNAYLFGQNILLVSYLDFFFLFSLTIVGIRIKLSTLGVVIDVWSCVYLTIYFREREIKKI